jgi:hypothetical protein
MRRFIKSPNDVIFAICGKTDGIDTEFDNSFNIWLAAKEAFETPTGAPEYDCLTQEEKQFLFKLLQCAGVLMLEIEWGADNLSVECEPFDRMAVKTIKKKLQSLGFVHDKKYQISVDVTF